MIYFRIIDPQKLVCSSDPVRVIMLAFGTLFVNELIHRFIFGLVKNKYLSYLKNGLFLRAAEPRLEMCLEATSAIPTDTAGRLALQKQLWHACF